MIFNMQRQVASLNNTGVNFLTLGQAREATAAFRSALSLLKDATPSPAGCDTPAPKEEEDTTSSKRSGASP
jgi:hypothetical protein